MDIPYKQHLWFPQHPYIYAVDEPFGIHAPQIHGCLSSIRQRFIVHWSKQESKCRLLWTIYGCDRSQRETTPWDGTIEINWNVPIVQPRSGHVYLNPKLNDVGIALHRLVAYFKTRTSNVNRPDTLTVGEWSLFFLFKTLLNVSSLSWKWTKFIFQ